MKILVTGNPTTAIAKGIVDKFGPKVVDTVSRSSVSTYMLDLTLTENIKVLSKISLNYDIFINSALVPNFGQTKILQAVWTEWKDTNKSGHIINFGSSVDYYFRPDNRLYPVEKRSLRDLNRSLTKHVTWFDSKIQCTYFSFGGVNTAKTLRQWSHYKHHDVTQITNYLEWIIKSPYDLNIDEVHITPIQPQTKKEMKKLETNVDIIWTSGDKRIFLKNEE